MFSRSSVVVAALSLFLLLLLTGFASSFPVKWCLTYSPIGHVRTDPIINPTCLSDHVHTFYGPGRLRPETTFVDLQATPMSESSGEVVDNKSLYWHPTIYKVDTDAVTGVKTYTMSQIDSTTTYYRFDDTRRQELIPFPEGLVMVAGRGEETTTDSECCDANDEECVFASETDQIFPTQACPLFSIWMHFPICWNGELDSPDHSSHVAYTTDGTLDGPCPATHQKGRFPQIQVFVRVSNYPGGEHVLSDGSTILHADFMNAWDDITLANIIANCQPEDLENEEACGCEDFLTLREEPDRSRRLEMVAEEEEEEDPEEPEEEEEFDEEEDPEEEEEGEEDEEIDEGEEGEDEEDGDGEEEEGPSFEVPLVDTRATITPEAVDVVVGMLPIGACQGELLPAASASAADPTNGDVPPAVSRAAPEAEEPEVEVSSKLLASKAVSAHPRIHWSVSLVLVALAVVVV